MAVQQLNITTSEVIFFPREIPADALLQCSQTFTVVVLIVQEVVDCSFTVEIVAVQ